MRRVLRIYHLQVKETEEPDITDTPVALLTVVSDTSTDHVQFNPARTAVELEGDIEITDHSRLADAIMLLFGWISALHLSSQAADPHFCQILMGLDDGKMLKPKLLSLKDWSKSKSNAAWVCGGICL